MMESKTTSALDELLQIFEQNRRGGGGGIYSVCASHPLVLEAAMLQAKSDGAVALIESTANQVNQFGGYTGMVAADFPAYVKRIADRVGLGHDRIVLGGDHLGPLCWTDESANEAMSKAQDLVASYVRAGFQKIHLDTSMACADDSEPLTDEVVAGRAARLCKAAEDAASASVVANKPVYVVGTEVPIPGGATEELDELCVTSTDGVRRTVSTHHRAFIHAGLENAWHRVVALVVQPGVEFNHTSIHAYKTDDAKDLSSEVLNFPGMVYEAHSTDYQPDDVYRQLVRDHFAILKVGPQLTFALREALFALCAIENEIVDRGSSDLMGVCERVMQDEPEHWIKHYPQTEPQGRVYRRYSYSDRIRYYWTHPDIDGEVQTMMRNLQETNIPLPLLSQHMPSEYEAVRAGSIPPEPRDLIVHHIMAVTARYSEACQNNE